MIKQRSFSLRLTFLPISYLLTTAAALNAIFAPAVASEEFRSLDGTGNNPNHPNFGAAETELIRLYDNGFNNGINVPRGGDFNSSDLPNPRKISNIVAQQVGVIPNFLNASDWLWQWGQFLDHDLVLNEANDHIEAEPEDYRPILVPRDNPDDEILQRGTPIIPFIRVPAAAGTGQSTPRQGHNQITAFIDASSVYGSDQARAEFLRDRTNLGQGLLKTTIADNGERLLPRNDPNNEVLNANGGRGLLLKEQFVAGDMRVNEHVGLTAVHTLLVREHNRLAAELGDRLADGDPELQALYQAFVTAAGGDPNNPSAALKDEFLYQSARKVVGAQVQAITYNEFLPLLIGDSLGTYGGYDSKINPSISQEFANAAYRLGHTLLSSQIWMINETGATPIRLVSAYFNSDMVQEKGVDSLLLGLATQPAQALDHQLVDEVRNFLFFANESGLDLAALNIARGREVGLLSYVEVHKELGLGSMNSFEKLPFAPEAIARFKQAYESVDQIDLWLGGIAELPADHGGLVGPTFSVILADQFRRLREGDRFFYLEPEQMAHLTILDPTVFEVTLADIIRRNTNDFVAKRMGDHAFISQKTVSGSAAITSEIR